MTDWRDGSRNFSDAAAFTSSSSVVLDLVNLVIWNSSCLQDLVIFDTTHLDVHVHLLAAAPMTTGRIDAALSQFCRKFAA